MPDPSTPPGHDVFIRIKAIEAEIENLKKQWPAHSTPPAMMLRLDELEEELESEKKKLPGLNS